MRREQGRMIRYGHNKGGRGVERILIFMAATRAAEAEAALRSAADNLPLRPAG